MDASFLAACPPSPPHLGFEGSPASPYPVEAILNEHDHPSDWPGSARKVLLLGLGNDILTDDAVGLQVVSRLRNQLAGHARVDVRETTEMGLALLDFITGYRAVVIVDSIQTGRAPPGTLHVLDATALQQLTGRTPHFVGVGETLALGRKLGLPMPGQVKIFAVEVADPFTLGTALSPALQAALPAITAKVGSAVLALAEA